MTEEREHIAALLEANWLLDDDAEFKTDDARWEPQGNRPLIKVYPHASVSHLVGRGESRYVAHSLTVSVRARNQEIAYAAKTEVCRILYLYVSQPFTGYDLMDHDMGNYRGGSKWQFQWDVETRVYQMRKPVVRAVGH